MPHNGQLLQRIMTEKRFTRIPLANAFNKQLVAIFRLIENHNIKSQDWWQLSSVIKVNMFQELPKFHLVQVPTQKEIVLQQLIDELQIELRVCKELLKGK